MSILTTEVNLEATDLVKYYTGCPICGVQHRRVVNSDRMSATCLGRFKRMRPPQKREVEYRLYLARKQLLNQTAREEAKQ
jgi:hypothetical protein